VLLGAHKRPESGASYLKTAREGTKNHALQSCIRRRQYVRLHSRPTSRGRSRIRSFALGLGTSPSPLGACAHRPETLTPSTLKPQKAKHNAIHCRIRSRCSDADPHRMGARPPVAHKSRETRAINLGILAPATLSSSAISAISSDSSRSSNPITCRILNGASPESAIHS